MKNIERQKALEKSRIKKNLECGQELYCKYCNNETECACARAYNRMMQVKAVSTTTERDRYSRRDFW